MTEVYVMSVCFVTVVSRGCMQPTHTNIFMYVFCSVGVETKPYRNTAIVDQQEQL